jgi:hypothetical protein
MLAGCGESSCSWWRSGAAAASHQAETAACVVAIDIPGGIRIDGEPLVDLRLETLERVLGAPDRTETIVSTQRYEEWPAEPGDPPTSDLVEVTDFHHVYDRLGLVFFTRNGRWGKNRTPEQIRLFFASERTFDHEAAPPVVPRGRGACRVELNGAALDPDADLRPPGATYQTEEVELNGVRFGLTSYTTIIDGLYTLDASPHLMLYLDTPATGRASYLEIVPEQAP